MKHPEMQQETPWKIAKKYSLDFPDSGKVKQVHPNFIPLASWEDEVIEVEALVLGVYYIFCTSTSV
jgi:hypothetical protein